MYKDEFNKSGKIDDAAYSGYEGYVRGLGDVMRSFYDTYPEYKGHVALVDLKALEEDREAELKRLSEAVGVEDIEETLGESVKSGHMIPGVNANGERIAVVAAWPIHTADPSSLTTEENLSYAGIAVHELGHAIDYMRGTLDKPDLHNHSNYSESYADGFRTALFALNGYDLGIKERTASYDKRQMAGYRNDRYDNGLALVDTYRIALKEHSEMETAPTQTGFYLNHWEKAREINDHVRDQHLWRHQRDHENWNEEEYDYYTRRIVFSAYIETRNEALDKIMPEWKDQEDKKSFLDNIRYLTKNLDMSTFESDDFKSKVSEETYQKLSVAHEINIQMLDWLEQRKAYIPDADRIIAGHKYLQGDGAFADYNVPVHDPAKFLGLSVMKYQETGNKLDLKLSSYTAQALKNALENDPKSQSSIFRDGQPQEIIEFLKDKPELCEALAQGITIEHALAGTSTLKTEVEQSLKATPPISMSGDQNNINGAVQAEAASKDAENNKVMNQSLTL